MASLASTRCWSYWQQQK